MDGPYKYQDAAVLAKDFVCGECGGTLLNPWGGAHGINGYIIRCLKDKTHQGVQKRGRETKTLYDLESGHVEVDILTQQIVPSGKPTSLATLPDTDAGMLSRIEQAIDVGKFPKKDITPQQKANLVKLALFYRLDPLGGEIMPYQGAPYITIEGRRRLDERSGNFPSIKMRPMDRETYQDWIAMDAITQGDIVVVGEFTDRRKGNTVETTGRVMVAERKGDPHLPIVKWSLEMAMKRCESRGRRMLYGPVTDPSLGFHFREDADDMIIDVQTGEIMDAGALPPAPQAPEDSYMAPPSTEEPPADALTPWDDFAIEVESAMMQLADVLPRGVDTVVEFEKMGGTIDAARKRFEDIKKNGRA